MSESGTGRIQRIQEERLETESPIPEHIVDAGDGSLTFATLVATRDALSKRAEECAQLVKIYDRAIANWTCSSEQGMAPPRLDGHSSRAARLLSATTPARTVQMLPAPLSARDEPSIIVVTDAKDQGPQPVLTNPEPIAVSLARPPPAREFAAETIRFAVDRPPRRKGFGWMLGVGILLAGLTTGAWLGVSSASTGRPRASVRAPELQTVATQAVKAAWAPVVTPLAPPPAEGVIAIPTVSISRFEVEWGSTSGGQLRVAARRAISKMKRCFVQTPRDALAFPATLGLSLRVHESGNVKWVKGVQGGGTSSAAQSCIERALLTTRFPPTRAGVALNTELTFLAPE